MDIKKKIQTSNSNTVREYFKDMVEGNNKTLVDRIEELMQENKQDRCSLSSALERGYKNFDKETQVVIDMFFIKLCGASLGRLIEEQPISNTNKNQPK